MLIPVTSYGKILIESGTFNSAVSANNESVFQFNYSGLRVKLVINLFRESLSTQAPIVMPEFEATIEDGVVVMKQPYKFNDQPVAPWGYAGMLVPFEMGVKPDGKKIYMSWKVEVAKSVGGALIAMLNYSFYEDE